MIKVAIILGSTRPGRNGEAVAKWVYDIASKRDDADYDLVDLKDFPLPHLDETLPPSLGQYANQHTKDCIDHHLRRGPDGGRSADATRRAGSTSCCNSASGDADAKHRISLHVDPPSPERRQLFRIMNMSEYRAGYQPLLDRGRHDPSSHMRVGGCCTLDG